MSDMLAIGASGLRPISRAQHRFGEYRERGHRWLFAPHHRYPRIILGRADRRAVDRQRRRRRGRRRQARRRYVQGRRGAVLGASSPRPRPASAGSTGSKRVSAAACSARGCRPSSPPRRHGGEPDLDRGALPRCSNRRAASPRVQRHGARSIACRPISTPRRAAVRRWIHSPPRCAAHAGIGPPRRDRRQRRAARPADQTLEAMSAPPISTSVSTARGPPTFTSAAPAEQSCVDGGQASTVGYSRNSPGTVAFRVLFGVTVDADSGRRRARRIVDGAQRIAERASSCRDRADFVDRRDAVQADGRDLDNIAGGGMFTIDTSVGTAQVSMTLNDPMASPRPWSAAASATIATSRRLRRSAPRAGSRPRWST